MDAIIPVIDVSGLAAGGEGSRTAAEEIGRACRSIGFFYVKGHQVPQALMQQAFAVSKGFFAADLAHKDAASIKRSPHNRGYVGMKVETLDPGKAPDLKEAFNLGLDGSGGTNLWPERPGFRETLTAYFDAVLALGRDLHKAIAVDLGVDASFFADKLDNPMAILRLLHYPPMPATVERGQLGAGEHTDYGNLTLLATDEVGGLEVRTRSGEWLAAPVVPGAFVCNIGDCLMRWTNDVYVSTPHRVVNPSGRERYSIAFFLDANAEALVECLPTCRTVGTPPKYPPVMAGDYLRRRLDATYAHRRTAG